MAVYSSGSDQRLTSTSTPKFNNVTRALVVIATAGGTTTLTASSANGVAFTGSTTQTLVLPVVSTLSLGESYTVFNRSSGDVAVQSSGLNTIQVMGANTSLVVTCVAITGTDASSWQSLYVPSAPFEFPLLPSLGGSGVDNADSSTITLGGAFEMDGAFDFVGTLTGATAVTFPESGTLATTATASGIVNAGTANQLAYYAADGDVISGIGPLPDAVITANAAGLPTYVQLVDGQLVIGSSTGAPIAATLTAGTGISITNGHNTITIASTDEGPNWSGISGTTQAAVAGAGYVIQNASQTTVTLPATSALGDMVTVQGLGAAGWILAANSGQTIQFGSSATSTAGNLTSANQWDCVQVVCVVANTTWSVTYALSAGLVVN
jgi:hypothetical protein